MSARFIGIVLLAVASTASAGDQVRSLHTPLAGKSCVPHVDDAISGANSLACSGVAGYKLQVIEDDERFSINVQSPDKNVHELDYWNIVTRAFSKLGAKAEWRVRTVAGKRVPVALIVRVIPAGQSASETRRAPPLLAVAQIRAQTVCVVATLDAANLTAASRARAIADGYARPCLGTVRNTS